MMVLSLLALLTLRAGYEGACGGEGRGGGALQFTSDAVPNLLLTQYLIYYSCST